MTISYPLSLPTNKGLASIEITQVPVVGLSASPFTGVQRVTVHQGAWWELRAELPPMNRADAEEWVGFLVSLNGQEGTFLAGDPLAETPRGIGTGSPQVNGASQLGKTLVTDGWTISINGILARGDWFQIGAGSSARLHKMTASANSDGGSNATLDHWPPHRSSPADNEPLILNNPVGIFRLAQNRTTWSIGQAQKYGINFSAIEAV